MGAGILPTCIHENKLYFLFGKERSDSDTPGWSDFGGGKENMETFMQTAAREGAEELVGFLGSEKEIFRILKKSALHIDTKHHSRIVYRMFIIKTEYCDALPKYYKNNHLFLESRISETEHKLLEKSEIAWICIDDLPRLLPDFRSYFQDVVKILCEKREEIYKFVNKKNNSTRKNKIT
jgi:hypothetical protein